MSEAVSFSVEKGVGTLMVRRPQALNALNRDVLQGVKEIVSGLAAKEFPHDECRVLVLRGEGDKAFVAGADIKLMSEASEEVLREFIELGQSVMRSLEELPLPVIAAVDGFAIGGGMELALAADIIVASKKAKFGQAEVNLGLLPGFGGTQRLVFRAGVGTAKKYVLTGRNFSAEDAYQCGIVDFLSEPESFEEELQKLSSEIASKAPLALASSKRVIRKSIDGLLKQGLTREVEEFVSNFSSADAREGLAAFLEKRSPGFKGR